MASVAICPHCYLQLVVPDGIAPDERVECPTCAKEFGLDQAVLRAIPEVVRCQPTDAAATAATSAAKVDEISVDEPVEVESIATATEPNRESDVLEAVKAKIEVESAALFPSDASRQFSPDEPVEDSLELSSVATQRRADIASSFREAQTPADMAELEASASSAPSDSDDASEMTPLDEMREWSGEQSGAEIETESGQALEAEIVDDDEGEDESEQFAETDETELEPADLRTTKPTVRTVADLLPPAEMSPLGELPDAIDLQEEVEPVHGPSFDLPNVPLTPSSTATVEIDPEISIGPAAETEFELDDVDFESPPDSDSLGQDVVDDDYSGPVFPEPGTAELPKTPFVIPELPRTRRKRSTIRTLVGVSLGGIVGIALGYYALLYIRGPEADFLKITKYVPTAVLPKSFSPEPTTLAEAAPASSPAQQPEAATAHEPMVTEDSAMKTAEAGTPTAETSPAESVPGETANVPASYIEDDNSPAAPNKRDSARSDDRYGTAPSRLEEPAAEPIADETAHPASTPLPLAGPTFTVEQLSAALEAAKQAQASLVAGDLSDAAVRRTKGMSYEKMSALAEALTFFDRSKSSVDSEDKIEAATGLFEDTLSNPRTRGEIAKIAQVWIDYPRRRNGGIFLAGSLSGGEIVGDLYEYQLATVDGNKLSLLMQAPVDPEIDGAKRPVGIVGVIVDKPAEKITGYPGAAERVIWVARTIPLE
jgi:hypothetical protein